MDDELNLKPIGIFRSSSANPYDLPRQPDDGVEKSFIELRPQQNFEQALIGLETFDRLWVLFYFHHNLHWKPMTRPPRGTEQKMGVFSTRSPYRPNPLGLSCLRLLKIEGLKIWVEGADLMDGTPILDLKPYVPLHDAFPEASMGWLESVDSLRWEIFASSTIEMQWEWLAERGETNIKNFIFRQLEYDPLNSQKKRVSKNQDHATLAYRTWRVDFAADLEQRNIQLLQIRTGYSPQELVDFEDRYQDKELHRGFLKEFVGK